MKRSTPRVANLDSRSDARPARLNLFNPNPRMTTKMGVRPKAEHSNEVLAEALMRGVMKSAGRRLLHVMEYISETQVVPLEERIAQLEAEIVRLGGSVPQKKKPLDAKWLKPNS